MLDQVQRFHQASEVAGFAPVIVIEEEDLLSIRLIEEERVTVIHGVPTMYQLLMREPSFDATRSIAVLLSKTGVIDKGVRAKN